MDKRTGLIRINEISRRLRIMDLRQTLDETEKMRVNGYCNRTEKHMVNNKISI